MSTTNVHIESVNQDGFGKAIWTRPDGLKRPVIVPFSLPGEQVEVTIRKSRRTLFGIIGTIQEKSPDRVEKRCRHFGSCGGCTFQHIHYEGELAFKEQEIRKLFSSYDAHIRPIMGSKETWNYRNKAEYSFSEDSKGEKYLGHILLHTRGHVFNLTECHLTPSWMPQVVEAVRNWWSLFPLLAFWPPKNRGTLRTLTLRHSPQTNDRVIILTVSGNPEYAIKKEELDAFVACCKAFEPKDGGALSIILRIQQQITGKPTQIFEMRLHGPESFREQFTIDVGGNRKHYEFQVSPSSFLQPNSVQASALYSTALTMASLSSDDVLYDLYAGIGLFGMISSHLVKQVVSIEINRDAAYDAKTNIDALGLKNVQFFCGDVAKVLQEEPLPRPNVVLVDPPRSGLGLKAVAQIVSLKPDRILYVSCNPKTQCEDVKELVKQGYKVEAIQPIDQFPRTIHVENIILLTC